MKMNLDALKALEAKLAQFTSENGSIAEHMAQNSNTCSDCYQTGGGGCKGTCRGTCVSKCKATSSKY